MSIFPCVVPAEFVPRNQALDNPDAEFQINQFLRLVHGTAAPHFRQSRHQFDPFTREVAQRRRGVFYISLQTEARMRTTVWLPSPQADQTMNCKHLHTAVLLPMLCLFTACAQQVPSITAPPASGSGSGECSAGGAQFAIGRTADATLVEQARQRSGARMARVLKPGQIVTMEFSSQRLTLDIDAGDLVTRARCG